MNTLIVQRFEYPTFEVPPMNGMNPEIFVLVDRHQEFHVKKIENTDNDDIFILTAKDYTKKLLNLIQIMETNYRQFQSTLISFLGLFGYTPEVVSNDLIKSAIEGTDIPENYFNYLKPSKSRHERSSLLEYLVTDNTKNWDDLTRLSNNNLRNVNILNSEMTKISNHITDLATFSNQISDRSFNDSKHLQEMSYINLLFEIVLSLNLEITAHSLKLENIVEEISTSYLNDINNFNTDLRKITSLVLDGHSQCSYAEKFYCLKNARVHAFENGILSLLASAKIVSSIAGLYFSCLPKLDQKIYKFSDTAHVQNEDNLLTYLGENIPKSCLTNMANEKFCAKYYVPISEPNIPEFDIFYIMHDDKVILMSFNSQVTVTTNQNVNGTIVFPMEFSKSDFPITIKNEKSLKMFAYREFTGLKHYPI